MTDTSVARAGVHWTLVHSDATTRARRGVLHTPHGDVETPVFMPVGTAGSVKAIAPDDLDALGARLILGNTYHLMLRPGAELIASLGGLHRFAAYPNAMLTDSGGFQVYSLAQRRTISEDAVVFRSHLDGAEWKLSPESSIQIQEQLGADIIMAFDECPPADATPAYLEESMARTTRWLRRCVKAWSRGGSSLFGIVQGGLDEALRRRHAEEIVGVELPGYALGGFALGEAPDAMDAAVAFCAPLLPAAKPRYLMGVGTPRDILNAVASGVDMFDCVLPTRCARNGLLFTSEGRLVLKNARYTKDERPLDARCGCYTCRTFSRAYLRHLYISREPLSPRLNSIHNLAYYLGMMRSAREAIARDQFDGFRREFLAPYALAA